MIHRRRRHSTHKRHLGGVIEPYGGRKRKGGVVTPYGGARRRRYRRHH